ncbi:MAG: endonuclease/exonuclease/phosphatase family protein [bacterium]|nr:endonuclease/exonuclease/phosphatase family protein [bacterium]MDZ4284593.1 endonuclease/exonuclease/phosphatase family protein [Patescibacteria group bacterium]
MGLTVLSLNVWNGRRHDELLEYLSRQSAEVDIFCLQEMSSTDTVIAADRTDQSVNLLQDFRAALANFEGYFAPVCQLLGVAADGIHVEFAFQVGLAMFIRRTLPLLSPPENVFVFGEYNKPVRMENKYRTQLRPHPFILAPPRTLQYVAVEYGGEPYLVYNFHGLWNGGPKVDTDERLKQSQRIRELLEHHRSYKKIFVGDFNLNLETVSLEMIEEAGGFRNLVFEYGIGTTRSVLYLERDRSPFADYALVSEDVRVTSFEVPKVAVSDHLPLIVHIE